jgi:hypothetical protein
MTEYERFGLVFTKTQVYKFGHWTFLLPNRLFTVCGNCNEPFITIYFVSVTYRSWNCFTFSCLTIYQTVKLPKEQVPLKIRHPDKKAVLWIRIDFYTDVMWIQLFTARIQGAKPMRIRILVRYFLH